MVINVFSQALREAFNRMKAHGTDKYLRSVSSMCKQSYLINIGALHLRVIAIHDRDVYSPCVDSVHMDMLIMCGISLEGCFDAYTKIGFDIDL